MRLKNVKGANDIIVKGIYYIDNPSIYKGKWHKLFNNNNPIYIELGMGKGDFIINNAIKCLFGSNLKGIFVFLPSTLKHLIEFFSSPFSSSSINLPRITTLATSIIFLDIPIEKFVR